MKQGGKRTKQTRAKAPKVSVVCVTFNAESTLPALLKNYSLHKTDDTELVIIDGNSTDNTLEIIAQNEALIDFWLSEPDINIYDAMNKAVKHTAGLWINFMGADDEILEGFVPAMGELDDVNAIYYGNVMFYGKFFDKVYDDYYLTKLNICHQGIFYPKAVFEKYQYDIQYKLYADYHLNLRCWKDPQFKFIHIDQLVAKFTEGGDSTHLSDPAFERDRDNLFKQYLKPASYYRYLNRTIGAFGALWRFITGR